MEVTRFAQVPQNDRLDFWSFGDSLYLLASAALETKDPLMIQDFMVSNQNFEPEFDYFERRFKDMVLESAYQYKLENSYED